MFTYNNSVVGIVNYLSIQENIENCCHVLRCRNEMENRSIEHLFSVLL